MQFFKRLLILLLMPVWLIGGLVCVVLTLLGIGYLFTGDFDAISEWWQNLPQRLTDWANQ